MSWVGLRGAVGDLPRLDPAAGRLAGGLSLFRRRLRGGAVVASDAGLDGGARRPQARHVVCAQRSAAAPGRARSARPVGARDRRLSGAGQQPVPAARADPELGAADAGGARGGDPHAGAKRIRCARATTSICWRRRKRRRRSTASSSTCRRRARPIRGCSATSSCRRAPTLGALAEIYGLQVAADHTEITLADYFAEQLGRTVKAGDVVELGPIALLAHKVERRPRHHRRPAAGRAGRAGRFAGAAQVLLAEDLGALGLGRAPHQRRRVLHQPGAAEQHRHPEQVAEHRRSRNGSAAT